MRKNFLTFGSPCIEKPEIQEVVSCLESGWVGTGPKVEMFERLFARYERIPFAVAMNSCTAALHLSLVTAGIERGDEVIVPTYTFASTAAAVLHAGATPVFADSDRQSFNLSPEDLQRKITRKTRAVIPVHFAGRACEMEKIMTIARRHKLFVIEDCSHAIETERAGKKAGTFGDFGCFSFYVTKNITTGEGGMVITRHARHARMLKVLALHGISQDAWKRRSSKTFRHYEVLLPGFKCNMMDLQAAIGIHQLKRIDQYWRRRREIWRHYQTAFEDLPLFLPAEAERGTRHAYHLYTPLLDISKSQLRRDELLTRLMRQKIGVGLHYKALHLHPFYRKNFSTTRGMFPNAEWISRRTFSLPLSAKMTDTDVKDVVVAVRKILKRELA